MNGKKIESVLKSFNENQIRQINEFLSSAEGEGVKKRLARADKEKLLKELDGVDAEKMKKRLKGMSQREIMNIIGKL